MTHPNGIDSSSIFQAWAIMWKAVVTGILFTGYAVQVSIRADSGGAFRNFRAVDPTGRYYVVVKRDEHTIIPDGTWGTPVSFEIAERTSGLGPVAPAMDSLVSGSGGLATKPNPNVKVRDGDALLGRGKLDRCSGRLLISSTGLGFVSPNIVYHEFGIPRSGDALAIVSRDGAVRHHKMLIDLFNEDEIRQFYYSVSMIFWYRGGWIDENRKEVIVAGYLKGSSEKTFLTALRTVNLETGKIQEGSSSVILKALSDVNRGGLNLALELAAERKLALAKQDLVKILLENGLPLEARLRAAVALASIGDRRGKDLIKGAAMGGSPENAYAIRNLPSVFGDEAATLLCEIVRRSAREEQANVAREAMQDVSAEAALPALLRLLKEDRGTALMAFTLGCLGDKEARAKPAIPDLMRLLEPLPEPLAPLRTQTLAAQALGRIGPDAKAALPILLRLARKYATHEWENVKAKHPKLHRGPFGDLIYSEDSFVDAICKIR